MIEAINRIQQVEKIISDRSVLFFDMDGTLIDTDYANFLSYSKAIQGVSKFDIVYNPDQRFTRCFLKNSIPNLNETDIERIIQEKEKTYKVFLPETKLIKPIVDILFKYSETNKTVLVTNCRKERALLTLNYHNLSDKFSHLIFRQNSENGNRINKYKNALNHLSLPAQNIIVFENEKTEIDDAVLAGISTDNIVSL